MRRQLVVVFVAVSTLVAVAFVVPLGFLVSRTAEDRAIDAARADASAIVPVLAAGGSRLQIESAIGATAAGAEGRLSVVTSQGWVIGEPGARSPLVVAALESGASAIGDTAGGVEVVAAVASGPGELSAVRVFVSDDVRAQGTWRAWSVLGVVGLALVAISVFVADRLAQSIVQPTRRLASAARRLGAGDLDARVSRDGPEELSDLAGAFNDLGLRVSTMLDRERELVAELSHRLRTPLTKLRLRVDQVSDAELASELHGDIADLTTVVNDLILEARGAIEPIEQSDLNQVVTDRAEFWRVLADDQMRPWMFRSAGKPLPVDIVMSDLVAAVDVMIENVFAHTDEGVALTIICSESDGFAELRVGDAGPGFTVDATERGTSTVGSTGLGLDIASQLAADASGSFAIGASELGGAEVVLSVPTVKLANN